MKIFIRSGVVLLMILAFKNTKAQYLEFIQNKGQWNSQVKFTGNMNMGAFYLQQSGYRVLLQNADDLEAISEYYGGHVISKTRDKKTATSTAVSSTSRSGNTNVTTDPIFKIRSHAYEVNFLGASKVPTIIPEKPEATYNNYFLGNDRSKWASHCGIYQAVSYKNMYPGIDVRYYTDHGNLKYDIIVNPGADLSKLALQFDGVDALNVKNGNLVIKTSLGDISELQPYTYQVNETGKTVIDAKYVVTGNTVRFKLGNFSRTQTLVIDPTLIFSTFTGSKADNWGYTATYDGQGNFYAGGIAFSDGFPVSNGAFQTTFQGGGTEGEISGYDIVIMKFNPSGSDRMYATYIGGTSNEQPHSMIVDNNGDLIISGRTSSANFPTTNPVYGSGGGFDIFITKLNSDGTALVGSRKFGGTADDGVNVQAKYTGTPGDNSIRRNYGDDARSEVIVDPATNNIFLASVTKSTDFLTSNAFQPQSGGKQDGVVIKTSSDLSNVLFSSYLGGNGDDAAFVLSLNPTNNNLYVAGGTTSTDLKGTSGNSGPVLFSANQGGVCDGFLSIIKNDGSRIVKTCYVGTAGNDLVYGVQFDKFGFPYIMGTTTVSFPVVNAAFASQSNGKQFITKMQPDLSGVVYSTNFGKGLAAPDISPIAFLVDRCENVYVSGWGGSTDIEQNYSNAGTRGLVVTSNAIQSTSPDNSDFYFFVLEKNASTQLYGSFFGENGGFGDHVDGGTSRFDKQGVIYQAMCANCGKNGTFPTTAGVWSAENGSTQPAYCNLAAIKIAFELAGVGTGVRASIDGIPHDTSGCIPFRVDFTDTLALGKQYVWNFGDGSADVETTSPNTSHVYTAVGNYRVRLISIDSSTCNIADTAYTNIRARNDRAIVSFTSLKLPPCDSLKYQFTNTSTAPPNKPFGPQSFTWSLGDGTTIPSNVSPVNHSYASAGTYNVVLQLTDTSYCNAPESDTVQLRIATNVKAQFETPAFGCAPYTAVFANTSSAGQQFYWDFGDGSAVSNDVNPVHLYTTPGNYTIHLSVFDSSTCNKEDSTSFAIVVSPKPTAAFTFSPQPPQENVAVVFTNSSSGGSYYKWNFGDGDTLFTVSLDTAVSHIYNKTGTYTVCLVAYNNYGCTDTTCQPVKAIVVPILDVPNAFTPNGDGINDVVRIRGFGIDKLNWKVYNRWGTMIFQSTSQAVGWDGKYKGALQPQEVYTYVLDVSFTDGTKYRKTGDITLLR